MNLQLIPYSEFQRISKADIESHQKLQIIADMCRMNTIVAVKNAGSGHLGSSLSSMDIVVWLYYRQMNLVHEDIYNVHRDIYLTSKGHDVPGLYSVLFSLGIISQEKILKLRRLGGLDGHPDVQTPGIEANSGSLGMGISKGKGIAWAKQYLNHRGHVYVMTGDGEFQEGQNFEALQTCVQQKIHNITVIMDHNKVQSDRPVDNIISLGDLERKISAFGWHVERMNGNDTKDIERTFNNLATVIEKPKFIIADTLKGKGVTFMEHPVALVSGKGLYPWHAGAPDDDAFYLAITELKSKINTRLQKEGNKELQMIPLKEGAPAVNLPASHNALGEPLSSAASDRPGLRNSAEYVVEAFGKALVYHGSEHRNMVVLDADLSSDCRLRSFENTFPERFIENGIAEQDMVSMAGGLAKQGYLPVVNSFSSFLASRANEQIYNNCTEQNKIIYGFHYAGIIPAGPGKSHQSIRDISLVGALPNMEILQPCNALETEMAVDYVLNKTPNSCVIRMNIGPSPREIKLPKDYKLEYGHGVTLMEGLDALILAYGPVMLNEAMKASEILGEDNVGIQVVNMPWLNGVDINWLKNVIKGHLHIFILEDHSPVGGLSDFLLREMIKSGICGNRRIKTFAVEGFPACGSPAEALRYHGLDGESLAKRINKHELWQIQ